MHTITDRALLLELAIALVPEAANVLWWLYERETTLISHGGDKVTCSTGVMQGCPLAAIAFSLVVKWLVAQMNHRGLKEKQFFMDDGLLYGTPVAMRWTLDLIEKLEPLSGLKLKHTKMSVHTPNAKLVEECRLLLPGSLAIHESEDMNFVYLKSPIGSDAFVEAYLEGKLNHLREEIKRLSQMTHLH